MVISEVVQVFPDISTGDYQLKLLRDWFLYLNHLPRDPCLPRRVVPSINRVATLETTLFCMLVVIPFLELLLLYACFSYLGRIWCLKQFRWAYPCS